MKSVGIMFACLALGFVIIVMGLSFAWGFSPANFFIETRKNPTLSFIYIPLLYGLILAVVQWRASVEKRGGIIGLGLDRIRFKWSDILLPSVTAIVLFFIYGLLLIISGAAKVEISGEINLRLILQALVFSFLFALIEEILFRGYILQSFLLSMKPWQAVVLSSLIFALLHIFRPGPPLFKIIYFLGIFSVGIVLSTAFLKGRSLFKPIALHFTWIVIMYLMPSIIKTGGLVSDQFSLLWGLDGTPPAGILGIATILLTGVILNRR